MEKTRHRCPALITFFSLGLTCSGAALAFSPTARSVLWVLFGLGLLSGIAAIVQEHSRRSSPGLGLAIAAVLVNALATFVLVGFPTLLEDVTSRWMWFP